MKSVIALIRRAVAAVLDSILPPRARLARTRSRTILDIPLSPTTHELLGVRITTLMEYHEEAVRDLIRTLKYDGNAHAARLAADVLADYLREEVASHKIFSQKKVLIVPIPLHASRRRERGFNQIGRVLDALPTEFRDGSITRVAHNALVRTRATSQQTHLSRSGRLSNVAGAFAASDIAGGSEMHVFIIDDVTTTGATLANAAQPLRRAGASVSLIALARA